MHRALSIATALAGALAVGLCGAAEARSDSSDNPAQVVVQFAAAGLPASVPWSFQLAGATLSGPGKVLANVGDVLSPSFPATVDDGQGTGIRYALDGVEPALPVKVDAGTTITGHYHTEYLLTVETSGLGAATTSVVNGAVRLGKATDSAPLQVWLAAGAPLSLAVDDPVAGTDWAFFQGLTPLPGATLAAPLSLTAGYASMPQLIDVALSTGGIFGPNAKAIAEELKQAWSDGPPVPDVGQPSRNGGVPSSFLTHVVIRAGDLRGSTIRRLTLGAAAVYREQICTPKLGRLRHALQYAWYAGIVLVAGGKPKPDC